MNPLMAFLVDEMRRNKDLKGLKRLLQEAGESQSKFWLKKKISYMEGVILVIKEAIQKVEDGLK